MGVQLFPLQRVPMVSAGDDIPSLILDALAAEGLALEDGDVIVVTGKIVSKAEGRVVNLRDVAPSERAEVLAHITEKDPRLVELVLRESTAVVRARPGNLIVRHHHGYVSAVAGIDRSNVDGDDDHAILLPEDPDGSAQAIRSELTTRTGTAVGIIISDSHGRPFRVGNMGVAIGTAGVVAVRELEGQPDLFGRLLTGASVVPTADLLASAAMLVSGEAAEGIPLVVIRGVAAVAETSRASALIRPADKDMFAVPDRDYP